VALCFIKYGVPVPAFFSHTAVSQFLISPETKDTISDLIIGMISAYIFYFLIELMPRQKREKETLHVMNSVLASVLDAYHRCRIYGHEAPISHVNINAFTKDWFISEKLVLQKNKSQFVKLKFATETAHSRLEDFRNVLPLAVTISPDKAMQWLVITDKIRLLAENYDHQYQIPENKIHLINLNTDENPIHLHKSSLNSRFLEVVEKAQDWFYPIQNSKS